MMHRLQSLNFDGWELGCFGERHVGFFQGDSCACMTLYQGSLCYLLYVSVNDRELQTANLHFTFYILKLYKGSWVPFLV